MPAGVGRSIWAFLAIALVALLGPGSAPTPAPRAAEAGAPPGFQETVALGGLVNPTVVRFASDGRVFVAEKSGLIKVFDDLSDPTPTTFADLRANVHNFWDRGLLGLALDPGFPTVPYVYVLYAYDHALGSTAAPPLWGDLCPNPPGATSDGCVVSGRLSRLEAAGNTMAGPEHVLVEDWCQQYPSHSVGTVEFGPDGALYASAGDGASFTFTDYGQDGDPVNPCGDPPGGVGGAMTPPSAQGGSLRSQDVRTSTDPATLDGSVIRVDPATGAALPSNPLAGDPDPNVRRVVAYGLRNPFRFAFRPGTSELWLGDVGWNVYEEVNRILDPIDATVENFGWPCYEGVPRQSGYDGANLTLCESLYATPAADAEPFFPYHHSNKVVAGEICPTGSSSISGVAFNSGPATTFPASYQDALFFSDYSRDCIWAMKTNGGALPSIAHVETFVSAAANPVNLQFGPGGDLFYVDFDGGTIRRVHYNDTTAPSVTSVTPANGAAGVAVEATPAAVFSENMDSSTITAASFTLVRQGTGTPLSAVVSYDVVARRATLVPGAALLPNATYTATVKGGPGGVKDLAGNPLASDVVWTFQTNRSPSPVIDAPTPSLTWQVGEPIAFTGHASDPEQGALPASALTWELLVQHCPSTCHSHTVQTWEGTGNGSFPAPDHDYPSHLELRLTATDAGGASGTTSIELHPETAEITFETSPPGLELVVGPEQLAAPVTRTYIAGTTLSLGAVTPQLVDGTTYEFVSWSDGGAQAHDVVVGSAASTYTATFAIEPPRSTEAPVVVERLSYPPVLSVDDGLWTGSQPLELAYQWLRCSTEELESCESIAGADTSLYVPTPADTGFRLRARVTATNAGGSLAVTTGPTTPR
jgi:glucose/arabinose dehydrogenase